MIFNTAIRNSPWVWTGEGTTWGKPRERERSM